MRSYHLIGMAACATSHYWARELKALGHEVRLMPPSHVKPLRETRQERYFIRVSVCRTNRPDTLAPDGKLRANKPLTRGRRPHRGPTALEILNASDYEHDSGIELRDRVCGKEGSDSGC